MSARTHLCPEHAHGPTHRSAPTDSIEIPITPRGAGGDRAPPLPVDRGAKQRADVGIGPYERRGSPIDHPGQRRRTERLRRGWEEGVGIVAEIIPKYPATSDNPSVALRATAPFAQGSLALRGTGERADTRVRPYAVIGIASDARRGGTEPAPYGSTGSAGLRADVPKAWPLPPKFRSEIWGVGHRHRPLRKDGNPDLLVPRGAATSHPL